MKHTTIRSALALALIAASFGLSACRDDHPDRGDRRPHGEHHDGERDGDHRDQPHYR